MPRDPMDTVRRELAKMKAAGVTISYTPGSNPTAPGERAMGILNAEAEKLGMTYETTSDTVSRTGAAAFNAAHPVGTPVRYWPGIRQGSGIPSRTRTPAWELPTGDVLVSVEGYPGGIALTHIAPQQEDTK